MPDDTTTTEGQQPEAGTTGTAQAASSQSSGIDSFPEEARDYIRRLRQENAGYRNELKTAKGSLKEIEDRDKTDQQRALERTEAAERAANAAALKLLRYEVAADAGLPIKLAARLQGSTKEELSADADSLKQEFGITTEGAAQPGSHDSGAGVRRPARRPATMNELIRGAAGRR